PGGAVIDYYLRSTPAAALTLQLLDEGGRLIRSYRSEPPPSDSAARSAADSIGRQSRLARKDSVVYEPADSVLSARAGGNRFVWNLRYPGAKLLRNTLVDEGTADGPLAVPGNYQVRLIVGRDSLSRRFT